jgi:predicted transcriptional regulator
VPTREKYCGCVTIPMHDLRYYEMTLKMRRPEIAIYSDIIDAIEKHGTKSNTKIQNSANLEYERMKRLMKKMQNFGLLDHKFDITDKGKNFRKDFEPARKIVTQIFGKYLTK